MSTPTSFTEVPTVDVSGLLTGREDDLERVAAELGRAAREVGFLYVTGAGVDEGRFDGLLATTRAFFALPLEEKMRVHIALSRCHRGYVPEGEEVFAGGSRDRKEAFDCGLELPADDPEVLAGRPLLGPNQWPDLPGFAAAVTAWYTDVLALGHRLLRAFAVALGEPADLFSRFVTRAPSQLRLIHYPHDPGPGPAQDRPGIGAHTDYECFTLLRPTAPGLEVRNGAGAWVDVPPRDGAFVVNIGDLLETWTNGRYVATTHRVRPVAQERYSFPLFFTVDYPTWVAPLPQLVAPGEPVRPGLVAGEHLWAQTVQTFRYLRERLERGEVTLPERSLALASFGHGARSGDGP